MPSTSSSVYEVVDPATLQRRLSDAEWLEAPLTEGVSPLTVVDLTGNTDFGAVAIPVAAPRVFVAIGARGSDVHAAYDVAIDDRDRDRDRDTTLSQIAATCTTAPRAATVAAQLLRTAEFGTVGEALWRESMTYSMLLAGPEFAAWRREYGRCQSSSPRGDEGAPVVVEDRGDRFDIILNRPRVHNAYNAAMRDALVEALRALSQIAPRPAVLLRGNGPSFCSGGDLDEFGTTPNVVDAHFIRTSRAPGSLLAGFESLTTTSVHGACIGAGTELAAFCARVEAAPDAMFRLPEVAMGLVPGAGGTVSVSRRIGRQRCAQLALTGVAIDAHTALEWGLIDAVVPDFAH